MVGGKNQLTGTWAREQGLGVGIGWCCLWLVLPVVGAACGWCCLWLVLLLRWRSQTFRSRCVSRGKNVKLVLCREGSAGVMASWKLEGILEIAV